ncbi:hypothetical protein [Tersicoccus sp. Bi-70]|uniref:hypothetical protein n=1 Tax=Tersicoccus sp. Bi-70 TaxID=1897634 RepID=UPI00117C9213|nr:hypothetical protein [Tersicoccus sp. Bi-70]
MKVKTTLNRAVKAASAAALAGALITGGSLAPAFADDLPSDPVVTDPGTGGGTTTDPSGGGLPAEPDGGACEPGWYFAAKTRGADTFVGVGNIFTNKNQTGRTTTVTFTSQTAGTVGTEVSGTLGTSINTALASVNATFGVSASSSKTVTTGMSVTFSVPNGKYGNGQYGAFKINANGISQYRTPTCKVTSTRSVSISSPIRVGWRTWID